MTNPEFSVIIPVKDACGTIGCCLDAIFANRNANFEVIVVDDGCTDNTVEIAAKYNCRILKNDGNKGVSLARNAGAFAAKGRVLVFIDSDIVASGDSLLKISEGIRSADAVVGMLSENTRHNNFSSQYKNLWMHYTFNRLPRDISLIFSSIAAVKKDAFLKLRGFEINYTFPNVEDNELGIRMREAGYNIILDKTLRVEHLKKYTFLGLLNTHYLRAKGLIKLFNRKGVSGLSKKNPSSVPQSYVFNILLSVALLCLLLSLLSASSLPLKLALSLFLFCLFIPVNYKWLHFLNERRGLFFVLKGLLYLPVESIVVLSGLAAGEMEYFGGRRY